MTPDYDATIHQMETRNIENGTLQIKLNKVKYK